MKKYRNRSSSRFRVACLAIACALGGVHSSQAQVNTQRGVVSYTRQVALKLTFKNSDVTWLGDPASPTALVYLKAGSRPIATDLCVTTLIVDPVSPHRRYFNEARIAEKHGERSVYAFTKNREKLVGTIDGQGHFRESPAYKSDRELLPTWPEDSSSLKYDESTNRLFIDLENAGPLLSESLDFLPLDLSAPDGAKVNGTYSIEFSPTENNAGDLGTASVVLLREKTSIILANAKIPAVYQAEEVQIGSFNNERGTYFSESTYRSNAHAGVEGEPSVIVSIPARFSSAVQIETPSLTLANDVTWNGAAPRTFVNQIVVDGSFDDWRNIPGVDDPRGDVVPYLEYIPDVDLLEFKVSHDNNRLYFYARVSGKVGRTHPQGGRAYGYVYMDIDQNAETGFLPTRDDDCYFGVDLGDDCEVQFEFVNNVLRKTFYGFCGIGGNENVLKQEVTLGGSHYGRLDDQGNERANYKAEYIFRGDTAEITEDLKLGTSDTIDLAVSPDGSEVEFSSAFVGFLKNSHGQPTVQLGTTLDLAIGMECDSKAYPGKSAWGADSTRIIRGYKLTPK